MASFFFFWEAMTQQQYKHLKKSKKKTKRASKADWTVKEYHDII